MYVCMYYVRMNVRMYVCVYICVYVYKALFALDERASKPSTLGKLKKNQFRLVKDIKTNISNIT